MPACASEEGGEREGGIRGRQGAATGKYVGPGHSGECFFIHDIQLAILALSSSGFRHWFSD